MGLAITDGEEVAAVVTEVVMGGVVVRIRRRKSMISWNGSGVFMLSSEFLLRSSLLLRKYTQNTEAAQDVY